MFVLENIPQGECLPLLPPLANAATTGTAKADLAKQLVSCFNLDAPKVSINIQFVAGAWLVGTMIERRTREATVKVSVNELQRVKNAGFGFIM